MTSIGERTRAYTEWFASGMYAACNSVTRDQANASRPGSAGRAR